MARTPLTKRQGRRMPDRLFRRALHAALAASSILLAHEDPARALDLQEAAAAFGTYPTMRGVRLSPDGQRIVFLMQHKEDFPIAMVADLRGGKPKLVAASDQKLNVNVSWCDWANDKRLLCGYRGIIRSRGNRFVRTRLVAVNDDGTNMRVLLQQQQGDEYGFHLLDQDSIIDWLPLDRNHILMEIGEDFGRGVVRVDINKNTTRTLERTGSQVWDWRSNGRGEIRVRRESGLRRDTWVYRKSADAEWETLRVVKHEDTEDLFWPVGFGDDPNVLLVLDEHEGREALFGIDLSKDLKRTLVFAHPDVDISHPLGGIGRHKRIVGVGYVIDKVRTHYFDPVVSAVSRAVETALPGRIISIRGESWDRRFYLIVAQRDTEAGTYFRFDQKTQKLARIADASPALADIEHSAMRPIRYPARDGTMIPAYLTLPAARSADSGPFPTVVVPHGGPYSRDQWRFSNVVQFLASRGYAVMQSNYRGSFGYGKAWRGKGAFQEWERATADIEDGIRYLIESGVADSTRICSMGFHYGGYASLISGVVSPDRYRCLISINGTLDPIRFADRVGRAGRRQVMGLLGFDRGLLAAGSPYERAAEIKAPVLLLHGQDATFPVTKHSEVMNRALKLNRRSVRYVEYKDVETPSAREGTRIEMFEEIGAFLEKHLDVQRP